MKDGSGAVKIKKFCMMEIWNAKAETANYLRRHLHLVRSWGNELQETFHHLCSSASWFIIDFLSQTLYLVSYFIFSIIQFWLDFFPSIQQHLSSLAAQPSEDFSNLVIYFMFRMIVDNGCLEIRWKLEHFLSAW